MQFLVFGRDLVYLQLKYLVNLWIMQKKRDFITLCFSLF